MDATTQTGTCCSTMGGRLGPIGIASRVVVGLVFITAVLWWRDPTWPDVVIGLVAMPAVAAVVLGWRARLRPDRLEATSRPRTA